jgi:hypothetical protein
MLILTISAKLVKNLLNTEELINADSVWTSLRKSGKTKSLALWPFAEKLSVSRQWMLAVTNSWIVVTSVAEQEMKKSVCLALILTVSLKIQE